MRQTENVTDITECLFNKHLRISGTLHRELSILKKKFHNDFLTVLVSLVYSQSKQPKGRSVHDWRFVRLVETNIKTCISVTIELHYITIKTLNYIVLVQLWQILLTNHQHSHWHRLILASILITFDAQVQANYNVFIRMFIYKWKFQFWIYFK